MRAASRSRIETRWMPICACGWTGTPQPTIDYDLAVAQLEQHEDSEHSSEASGWLSPKRTPQAT